MRIRYKRSGGLAYLPGLQKAVEIDVDQLDAPAREELRALVERAGFFQLPTRLGAQAAGSADLQSERLEIEDQGRRHEVQLLAPTGDDALARLVQAVRRHARPG